MMEERLPEAYISIGLQQNPLDPDRPQFELLFRPIPGEPGPTCSYTVSYDAALRLTVHLSEIIQGLYATSARGRLRMEAQNIFGHQPRRARREPLWRRLKREVALWLAG